MAMTIEQEFISLISQHQKIIYKVCHLYFRDKNDRDDLFQEIILQTWKSFSQFKGEAKFSTWLYKIALNTAITHYKKVRKQLECIVSDQLPERADDSLSNEHLSIALYKEIDLLSKIEKAIILLYLEKYCYQDIGELMGISANHVAVKMNRIKSKLKAQINKNDLY
jgi:RNA polymerase sigma-70 factor (ECF subfamily)